MIYEYADDYGYDSDRSATIFTESMDLFLEDGNGGLLAGIGGAIESLIKGLMNFIRNLFGGKNKDALDEAEEAFKRDPSLKNQKVTYYSADKYNAENARHAKAVAACNSEEALAAENRKHSGLLKKIAPAGAITAVVSGIIGGIVHNRNAANAEQMESDFADPNVRKVIEANRDVCSIKNRTLKAEADQKIKKAETLSGLDKMKIEECEKTLRDAISAYEKAEGSKVKAVLGLIHGGSKNVKSKRAAYAQGILDQSDAYKKQVDSIKAEYEEEAKRLSQKIAKDKKELDRISSGKRGTEKNWIRIKQLEEQIAHDKEKLRHCGDDRAKKIEEIQRKRLDVLKPGAEAVKGDKQYQNAINRTRRGAEHVHDLPKNVAKKAGDAAEYAKGRGTKLDDED